MFKKKNLLLAALVISSIVFLSFASDANALGLELTRVKIPIAYYNGKLTCAASFLYGQYTRNPERAADMLSSSKLESEFDIIEESKRWEYPEYVVIKHYLEWKNGNKQEYLRCYEPGPSFNRASATYKMPSVRKNQSFWEPLNEIIFLDKSMFGPFVRISFAVHERTDEANKKGRALPATDYLRYINGKFKITKSITDNNIFGYVVKDYGAKSLIERKNVKPLEKVETEYWFAVDVSSDWTMENKKMLVAYSTDSKNIPPSFSENYLQIYLNFEPVNTQLKAGQQAPNLSPEIRFFESAVTATHLDPSEDKILRYWHREDRKQLQLYIERLKSVNRWPEYFVTEFSESPTVLAKLRTSEKTLIYYIDRLSKSIDVIGVIKKTDGEYELCKVSNNLFSAKTFKQAIKALSAE